jgi:hypothetical protein
MNVLFRGCYNNQGTGRFACGRCVLLYSANAWIYFNRYGFSAAKTRMFQASFLLKSVDLIHKNC